MPRGIYVRTKEHLFQLAHARKKIDHKSLSGVRKSLWKQPEYREKMEARRHPTSKNCRRAALEVSSRVEVRRLRRENKLEWWSSLSPHEKAVALKHLKCVGISKPQISVLKRICRRGINGFCLNRYIRGFFLDVSSSRRKICIEVDGPYWHRDTEARKHDRLRDRILRRLGWKVYRIGVKRDEATRLLECLF